MPYEFKLQDPGEGIHEAEIIEILVAKGDRVSEGDDVLVAETDKAAVEIPAPVSGEVQEIRVATGDIVNVGDVLIVFGDAAETADGEQGQTAQDAEPEPGEPEADASSDSAEDAEPGDEESEDEEDDPATSGLDEPQEGEEDSNDREEERRQARPRPEGSVSATPAVRGLAREFGVKLDELEGSGQDGRILEDDVRNAAKSKEEAAPERDEGGDKDADEEVRELRSFRRATARRMAAAWRAIPHVTHHDVVDITALERLRREHAAEIEAEQGSLTLTPFLVKALAVALPEFPDFNATFDADARAVRRKRRIDICVAMDTERGLLAPVLRDAGQASIAELAGRLNKLQTRLREGSARAEELSGGTFTLTNIGSIGGTGLSPIINPPQTAIFGAARAELRQVVKGDLDSHETAVAFCLPVSLTFDHRAADGAQAARFVNLVRALLGDPGKLILRG